MSTQAKQREEAITAAIELEKKLIELIKKEEPELYLSNVAQIAVRFLKEKF